MEVGVVVVVVMTSDGTVARVARTIQHYHLSSPAQPQVPPQRTAHFFHPRRPGPGSSLGKLPRCESVMVRCDWGSRARLRSSFRRCSPIHHSCLCRRSPFNRFVRINNKGSSTGARQRDPYCVCPCPSCFASFPRPSRPAVERATLFLALSLPSLCDRDSFHLLRCPVLPPHATQQFLPQKTFNIGSCRPFPLDTVHVPRFCGNLYRQPSEKHRLLTSLPISQYSELRSRPALALHFAACLRSFVSLISLRSRCPRKRPEPLRPPSTLLWSDRSDSRHRPGHHRPPAGPRTITPGALRLPRHSTTIIAITTSRHQQPKKRPSFLLYIAVGGRSIRVPQQPWALPVPRAAEVCNAFLPPPFIHMACVE